MHSNKFVTYVKMHKAIGVLLLLVLAVVSRADYYSCGGGAGPTPFNDEFYYNQYGEIRGFEVWHGAVVDGIRLKYGNTWGPAHVGSSASHSDLVLFDDGEYLTGIHMDRGIFWGWQVSYSRC